VKAKKTNRVAKGMLDLQQASRLLKISTSNLYAYVKGKKIPFKKDGRRLLFSKPDLEKWNKKRGSVSPKAIVKSADAITVAQAAKLLNISAVTLYYHIKKLRIPVILKKGKSMFYSKKTLLNIVGSKLRKKQTIVKAKTQAKSAKPAVPAKKAAPAKKSKPAKAKKSVQSKQPKESKPAKESKALKEVKPIKEVTPIEEAKPVKKAKAAKKSVKAKKAQKAKKPMPKKQPQQKVEKPAPQDQTDRIVSPEPEKPQQDQNNQE
jgi:excisionase family DNA binding protein